VKPPQRGKRKRKAALPPFFGARGRLPPLNDFDFDFYILTLILFFIFLFFFAIAPPVYYIGY
jgi:hypothetical protein